MASEMNTINYDSYLADNCRIDQFEQEEIVRHIDVMLFRPEFILLIEGNDDAHVQATRLSCAAQIYPPKIIVRSFGEAIDQTNDRSYLVWVRAGDRLNARALYEFASALNSDRTLELIYCDEDTWKEDERSHPFFKPDWSPDYLESMNYIGPSACYKLSSMKKICCSPTGQYDLVLRFTEHTDKIGHIRKILLHRRESSDDVIADWLNKENIAALTGRLSRTNRDGEVTQSVPGRGCYTTFLRLRSSPSVSIVIPTAAKVVSINGQSRDLIVACLDSIVRLSTYKNFEIVLVDNGDLDESRINHVTACSIRKVSYHDGQVNIAKKLNMGAACASGDILILLNDDTEVITPSWIERLVAHFEKPHVGAVGAKLIYPDMTIQHAGIVSIQGHPDHVTRYMSRCDRGYFFSNAGARNYLGVTGALTATRAKDYREVGGYDENLPLCFNDVDFCYKIVEKGRKIVYEPSVELIHFESISASNSYRIEDRDLFLSRWGHKVMDPYYNSRCLAQVRPTFAFSNNHAAV